MVAQEDSDQAADGKHHGQHGHGGGVEGPLHRRELQIEFSVTGLQLFADLRNVLSGFAMLGGDDFNCRVVGGRAFPEVTDGRMIGGETRAMVSQFNLDLTKLGHRLTVPNRWYFGGWGMEAIPFMF